MACSDHSNNRDLGEVGWRQRSWEFKLNMQVVNVAHPNSIHKTRLLAVFEAGDSPANLHAALDQYQMLP